MLTLATPTSAQPPPEPQPGVPPETPPPTTCPPPPGQPFPPGCNETPPPNDPGVPPPPPQPDYPPSPSTGGLTAPPPMEAEKPPEPPKTPTEQELDKTKEEDSGRGPTWFYLDVEGGFQHIGLETFEIDRQESQLTAGFVESSASGGYVGMGLGARIFFITIGPRGRIGFFPDWQLFSIGGELGFRIPIGIFEPNFSLGAGYTALGSFSGALEGVGDAISIRGFDVRVAGGLDIFVTNFLALGFGASWEFLGLTRPGVSLDELDPEQQQNVNEAQASALAAEGSGFGSAITITARVGFHF
jgi:hypothetical protein